ncbi:hypothetical protein THAOC_06167, partial [Thalassiosira oceanica]
LALPKVGDSSRFGGAGSGRGSQRSSDEIEKMNDLRVQQRSSSSGVDGRVEESATLSVVRGPCNTPTHGNGDGIRHTHDRLTGHGRDGTHARSTYTRRGAKPSPPNLVKARGTHAQHSSRHEASTATRPG